MFKQTPIGNKLELINSELKQRYCVVFYFNADLLSVVMCRYTFYKTTNMIDHEYIFIQRCELTKLTYSFCIERHLLCFIY